MSRPSIPAEIKRAVLVEAGHRCAIPRCGSTELDIHHIVPWEECKKHEYSNLIALCPVCHRRAHNGEIDRKSLFLYKENLSKDFGPRDNGEFYAQIVEIRRRISEVNEEVPGFYFVFDFPDFREPVERIVSRNIEAWGYELLTELGQYEEKRATEIRGKFVVGYRPSGSTLTGDYRVVRRDDRVISIEYTIDRYYSGAAHGGRETRVQNFVIKPFHPITLDYLLGSVDELPRFAEFVRNKLAQQKSYEPNCLVTGTEPEVKNFSLFNIEKYGIRFTFSEYQIDCYAAGEQHLFISFCELKDYIQADVLSLLEDRDDS